MMNLAYSEDDSTWNAATTSSWTCVPLQGYSETTLKDIREGNTLSRTFRDAFSRYLYLQEYLCRDKVYVNLWAAGNGLARWSKEINLRRK